MLTIYTAIFGGFDKLHPPEVVSPHLRYVCYTDDSTNVALHVETVVELPRFSCPNRSAKWYKLHPPPGDTLWIDGGYQVLSDPTPWLEGLTADVGLCGHAARACPYMEGKTVKRWRPAEGAILAKQLKRYRKEGLPPHFGLWEGGCIFRRDTPAVAEFNALWWSEIENGSLRDQTALSYCIWKTGIAVNTLPSRMPQMLRQHRHEMVMV